MGCSLANTTVWLTLRTIILLVMLRCYFAVVAFICDDYAYDQPGSH